MEELTPNALSVIINDPIYIIAEAETKSVTEKSELPGPEILIYTSPLNNSDKAFLSKILSAVGLSIDNVRLEEGTEFSQGHFDCSVILSFGVPLSGEALYQIVKNSGKTLLSADEISRIQVDVNLKKQLWGALQKIFTAG